MKKKTVKVTAVVCLLGLVTLTAPATLFGQESGSQQSQSQSMDPLYDGMLVPTTAPGPIAVTELGRAFGQHYRLPEALDMRLMANNYLQGRWVAARAQLAYCSSVNFDSNRQLREQYGYRAHNFPINMEQCLDVADSFLNSMAYIYYGHYDIYRQSSTFVKAFILRVVGNDDLLQSTFQWIKGYLQDGYNHLPASLQAAYQDLIRASVDYVHYLANGGLESERAYLARSESRFTTHNETPEGMVDWDEISRYQDQTRRLKAFWFRRVNSGQISLVNLQRILREVATMVGISPQTVPEPTRFADAPSERQVVEQILILDERIKQERESRLASPEHAELEALSSHLRNAEASQRRATVGLEQLQHEIESLRRQ